MIHYHGGPITPETSALRVWSAGHAFISWVNHHQIEMAASVCQSFALDNGAFTIWKQAKGDPHWQDYYAWVAEWKNHPACDWAVIPDVIEGTEEENDQLISEWPHGLFGVPVWHMNESVDRLVRLAKHWPRIALGSAAEFDVSKPSAAVGRLRDVLPAISDTRGRPLVKLHGLRMLNPAIVERVPLSSGDSTNIARNIGMDRNWTGSYAPATRDARADVLRARIERHQSPDSIFINPTQGDNSE